MNESAANSTLQPSMSGLKEALLPNPMEHNNKKKYFKKKKEIQFKKTKHTKNLKVTRRSLYFLEAVKKPQRPPPHKNKKHEMFRVNIMKKRRAIKEKVTLAN